MSSWSVSEGLGWLVEEAKEATHLISYNIYSELFGITGIITV